MAFAALEDIPLTTTRRTGCELIIDVAPGQSLWVGYGNPRQRLSGYQPPSGMPARQQVRRYHHPVAGSPRQGRPVDRATLTTLRAAAPSSTAPTSSPFAPRPVDLPLDNVNPCTLLTATQTNHFRFKKGSASFDTNGPVCNWSTSPPRGVWTVALDLDEGADSALHNNALPSGAPGPHEATQTTLDGYGMIETGDTMFGSDSACILYIDVAPLQNLKVEFLDIEPDYPGLNHQLACQLATQIAHPALHTLRTLAH